MKYRHTMLLLYISLPICVILRTIQMIFTIDYGTGFIKQQYSVISPIITVVICAAVAAVSLLSAACEINPKGTTLRPGIAAASFLVGGMFVCQMAADVANLSFAAWYDMLLMVLGLVAALAFIAYGLKNVYDYKLPSIVLVVPTIYYVVRLISLFIGTSKLAMVTENIFMLFTNSVILLFVFELACLENEIGNTQKSTKKLFVYGVATIMTCVTTSLPKLILIVTSDLKFARSDIAVALLNLSIAVFAFAYIVCNYKEKTKLSQKAQPKHLAE